MAATEKSYVLQRLEQRLLLNYYKAKVNTKMQFGAGRYLNFVVNIILFRSVSDADFTFDSDPRLPHLC